jgi:hypothetical protein
MAEHSGFIKLTSISSSNHVNKSVISLDGLLLEHVTKEENNMMIISTDDDNGNKLIIPRCKVFSEDRKNGNTWTQIYGSIVFLSDIGKIPLTNEC